MTKKKNKNKYKFIDLFAGIGGFHLAFHKIGAECVFASEWDKHARKTYELNHKKKSPKLFKNGYFNSDINDVKNIEEDIPDFNILTGGFPCQPFSNAGYKKGFEDTRGTLFFKIAEIIKIKQPEAYFIENVRGLLNHDNGRTFATIKNIIENDLGYSFNSYLVKASDYGLPQMRPRIFMIGFKNNKLPFKAPKPVPLKKTMSDIWNGDCDREIGLTLRCGGRGSNINDRRNWDSYRVNGKVRQLGPEEGKEMQGFPKSFKLPNSQTIAMKQLGNSVAVPAIQVFAKEIIRTLEADV